MPGARDGREVTLRLTRQGEQTVAEAAQARKSAQDRMGALLGSEGRSALALVAGRITAEEEHHNEHV